MVPKSGTYVPNSCFGLSEAQFACEIASALRSELGGSHRATKTVMSWANVSNRTARKWLSGDGCPSGLHLVHLSARSQPVLMTVLRLAGQEQVALAVSLEAAEQKLEDALAAVRELRSSLPETRNINP